MIMLEDEDDQLVLKYPVQLAEKAHQVALKEAVQMVERADHLHLKQAVLVTVKKSVHCLPLHFHVEEYL